MNRRSWGTLLLIVFSVALTCCYHATPLPKPAVILIHGDPDTVAASKRVKVLFLGDGFVEADLAAYRTAVRELTEGLLAEPPFDTYADSLNFYRIDVLDSGGETKDGCTADVRGCNVNKLPVEGFAKPDTGTPVGSGAGPLDRDLGAKLCSQGDDKCETLGIDAEQTGFVKRLALASELRFDAVVIVANAQNLSGSAPFFVEGDIGVAVVGVGLTGSADNLSVSRDSVLVFSHEFGHALGLLDEEPGGVSEPPDLPRYHNVWKPRPYWRPDPDIVEESTIPWWSELTEGCEPHLMEECVGRHDPLRNDACVATSNTACVWTPSALGESVPDTHPDIPGSGADSPNCIPKTSVCGEFPGAWEGAYYHVLGYYRAEPQCRMKRVVRDPAVGFCKACKRYLGRVLCLKRDDPDVDCPPERPPTMADQPGGDVPQ